MTEAVTRLPDDADAGDPTTGETKTKLARRVGPVLLLLLGLVLVSTGDLSDLANTTVLLLLVAFTAVNVSVLVLRRDEVDHDHFRAPVFAPVLAAIASVVLIGDNEAEVFIRAGLLLLLGVVLWIVAYAGGHRTGEHRIVER